MENFGLVLSGGGAKGAYQIGALKALKNFENKITIKAISGSSIGGINAAAFLSISLEQIESLWKQFTFQDFFDIEDNLIDGLASRQALISLLNKIIDENKLQKAIPCFNTICIDEYNPEYKLINNKCKKEIIEILLATSALPVIYSKVNIKNNFYQDGGIADNLPIAPLYRNEIKNFICISLSENLRIDRSKYNLNNLTC